MKIQNENVRSESPANSRKGSIDSCEACMTLTEAINNKKVKVGFRKFLESEFSIENLDFWLAVEQYKKITDDKLRKSKANEIYDEYVSPTSPSQVNIDHRTRQQIVSEMSNDGSHKIGTFDAAQKYVFTIMENDSYARFIRSKFYDICSQSGRRSPRKFLQDILQNTTRSRRRTPSPNCRKGKRLSDSSFTSTSSNSSTRVAL